ncbi:hypothetical protein [Methylobacterium nodulans]|uniref:Uncharacterized protein n=1 Tax=Methylobacterium nodulans (strain LMG 21967 / CNCM I-2342 / ORS 2060) TaxID=460265 RepID=B8ISD4_METNO|nr:hypothetical protein [Methylobacterium nodulans]ACL58774.1 hypothetical protein Mnod_3874 [Methylobacterium nodulans ORS 2060]
MSEEKKPEVPRPTPVTRWPPDVQKALFELVAFAHNHGARSLMFNLDNLTHDGQPLGSFEIEITRTD